jgi:predicted enzyme related to lactoylglutathione lyase
VARHAGELRRCGGACEPLPFRHQRRRRPRQPGLLRTGARLDVHGLGPPGFFQIRTGTDGDPGVQGALQQRRALLPGVATVGPECTFAVDDLDAVAAAVRDAGGEIVMDRFTISGVGHLIFFRDPDGNVIGAMQHDTGAE